MSFDNPYFPTTFDIGTPGAGHMHFGSDGSQTLYGPDGVTVLFSLDPTNGMQVNKGNIVGSLIETAASGARVVLDGTGQYGPANMVRFFDGTNDASTNFRTIEGSIDTDQGGNAGAPSLFLKAGAGAAASAGGIAGITLVGSKAADGNQRIAYGQEGIQSVGATHRFYGPVRISAGSVVGGNGLIVDGQLTIGGDSTITGKWYSKGPSAGFSFYDEGGANNRFEWYFAGGAARLWNDVITADVMTVNNGGGMSLPRTGFTIDNAGNVATPGGVEMGNGTAAQTRIWGVTGAPPAALGGNGDYAFRGDTPGTANQRIYVKNGAVWVGIL